MISRHLVYYMQPVQGGGWLVSENDRPLRRYPKDGNRDHALAFAIDQGRRHNGYVLIDNLEFIPEDQITWPKKAEHG